MANNNVLISIDSRYRDKLLYPNSGYFTYFLPNKYSNVISIKLVSIEFPNLFYTFTSIKKNISFYIQPTGLSKQLITIKQGNYTSTQIIDELNDKFKVFNSGGVTIIASLDTVSGCTTISATALSLPINFEIDFSDFNLGKHLGYKNNLYIGNSSYTSEGIMDVIGDPYFYIRINDYGDLVTQFGGINILGKIILNKSKTVMVFDNQANFLTKSYTFINTQTIQKLNIELIDINGVRVDMVNLDYSLTLELKMAYDNSKVGYYDSLKNNFEF
jgi:hypothetical protein